MSQWGVKRTISGDTFLPLLDTAPFAEAGPYSCILDVILIDRRRGEAEADETLEDLKAQHVGEPYEGWAVTLATSN